MKISVTTALGWVRFVICLAILGHVLWTMFHLGIYSINVQYGIACVVVQQLCDKLLGGVAGHFTADSASTPPSQ